MRRVFLAGTFLLFGCANHPVDCAMGFYHSDCLPGTTAYENARSNALAAQANDDALCRSYGAVPGTDVYTNCRVSLNQNRSNAQNARMAVAAAILANRPATQAPAPYQMPIQKQMQCHTQMVGDQAVTTCQ